MTTNEKVTRQSIIHKAGGILACDWVTGLNSFAWEVLNSYGMGIIITEQEAKYYQSLQPFQRLVLNRDVSAFARNLTNNRKLEVFVI